jgi:hypothetical protein
VVKGWRSQLVEVLNLLPEALWRVAVLTQVVVVVVVVVGVVVVVVVVVVELASG